MGIGVRQGTRNRNIAAMAPRSEPVTHQLFSVFQGLDMRRIAAGNLKCGTESPGVCIPLPFCYRCSLARQRSHYPAH